MLEIGGKRDDIRTDEVIGPSGAWYPIEVQLFRDSDGRFIGECPISGAMAPIIGQ